MESGDRLRLCRDSLPVLQAGAAILGISLDSEQTDRFLRYCNAIRHVNQRMNLTALRTPDQIMRDLFLDSLTVEWALRDRIKNFDSELSLVDVGSGAGIPGLPLKIVNTRWHLVMIESVAKKARFLESVVAELDLRHTLVAASRAEEAGWNGALRDTADICTARALASLPVLLEWCAPLTASGGFLCFPKSAPMEREINEADEAARILHAQFEEVVSIPSDLGLHEDRVVVLYRKTDTTPPEFPRRIGLARIQPLGARSREKSRGGRSQRG